jgi:hypothetical protein
MQARLEKVVEDLRRAVDETTSLRAQLHAAEPPIPVCGVRKTGGAADNSVLERLEHLRFSVPAFGLRVTRVSADGDRKFGTLLRPGWEALRDPLRWEFARPVMAQEDLIRAVTERLDCLSLVTSIMYSR